MKRGYFQNGWAFPLLLGDAITLACRVFYKSAVNSASNSAGLLGHLPFIGGHLDKAVKGIKFMPFNLIGKLFPVFLALTLLLTLLWVLSRLRKGAGEAARDAAGALRPGHGTDRMDSF